MPSQPAPPTALVVEDDKNLSLAFGEALEQAGYQVEIARDGKLAVQHLQHYAPNTIVLDLHIPYINGEEILALIRASQRHAHTKVIVVSADDRKAQELRERADLVLIKPIGFNQLKEMATRLMPGN
jgi:DNA-binding response OmpR family regulator